MRTYLPIKQARAAPSFLQVTSARTKKSAPHLQGGRTGTPASRDDLGKEPRFG